MSARFRAPRNKTIEVCAKDATDLSARILNETDLIRGECPLDVTIHADMRKAVSALPDGCVDLLVLDPPYNLSKDFGATRFPKRKLNEYENWFREWLPDVLRLVRGNGSVYVCSDWATSPAVYSALADHLIVRNRITWEREKGRGALSNWKNCSEDIWFCTRSDRYHFDAEAVRLRRRVVAPYKQDGRPKGWSTEADGQFRFTAPSNLWTDITVPFWSMPENTDHPTQKPEKLVAKLVLASTRPGDVVLDPFLGSGTTSVVSRKLDRRYVGIDSEMSYCLLAEKRLSLARNARNIQGYEGGVFLERNTLTLQMQQSSRGVGEVPEKHDA